MPRIVDRHQTFVESENWLWERIEADPTLLADTGFYYLGDGDWVKRWYCNGYLKKWERFDDPWLQNGSRSVNICYRIKVLIL